MCGISIPLLNIIFSPLPTDLHHLTEISQHRNMAPPLNIFPASKLPDRIHMLPNGKRRKGEPIDLKKCELLEMINYDCRLKGDESDPKAVIRCEPLVKLFRKYVTVFIESRRMLTLCYRCAGGLMVETTLLES